MENVSSRAPFNWAIPIAAVSTVAFAVATVSLFGPHGWRFLRPDVAVPMFTASLLTGSIGFATLATGVKKGEAKKDEKVADEKDDLGSVLINDARWRETVERRLEIYLQKHPTGLTKDTIFRYEAEGREYVKQMMEGTHVKASLHNATAVIWHLTLVTLATEGRGYDSWMWKIEDPDGKLAEFFHNLPGAYNRVSTHFEGKQKGYDFGGGSGLLPGGKRVALARSLDTKHNDKKFVALKLELWGLNTPPHTVMHGYEYLKAVLRKKMGWNDQAGMRKEHLPEDLKPFAKQYGVRQIWELHKKRAESPDLATALDRMNFRHPEFATGNEVVFLKKDFIPENP